MHNQILSVAGTHLIERPGLIRSGPSQDSTMMTRRPSAPSHSARSSSPSVCPSQLPARRQWLRLSRQSRTTVFHMSTNTSTTNLIVQPQHAGSGGSRRKPPRPQSSGPPGDNSSASIDSPLLLAAQYLFVLGLLTVAMFKILYQCVCSYRYSLQGSPALHRELAENGQDLTGVK